MIRHYKELTLDGDDEAVPTDWNTFCAAAEREVGNTGRDWLDLLKQNARGEVVYAGGFYWHWQAEPDEHDGPF
jgi:hypothetical protein